MGAYLLFLNSYYTTLKTKVKYYFSEFNPTIIIDPIPYKIMPIVTYTPMPIMLLPPLHVVCLATNTILKHLETYFNSFFNFGSA